MHPLNTYMWMCIRHPCSLGQTTVFFLPLIKAVSSVSSLLVAAHYLPSFWDVNDENLPFFSFSKGGGVCFGPELESAVHHGGGVPDES